MFTNINSDDRKIGLEIGPVPTRGSRKTVFFLVTHSNAGGAQEIWANLADGFRERGFQVTLIALYPSEASKNETLSGRHWRYIVNKRPVLPHDQIAMLGALTRLFRNERPKVVFTALPAANILAPIAARLAGVGTQIVTSHHSPSDTYHPILDKIDALTGSMRDVKAIVSVSRSVQDTHAAKPGAYRAKLRTIKNALPTTIENYIAELAAQRPRNRARGRLVIATGRLAPQKNYPVLIRAIAHTLDVELHIIGSGAEGAPLKALTAELGVADRVKFIGFRPRSEALALLAKGDLFVQPSLFEGHSLALVEAAKLGLPLIVSDAQVQIEGVTDTDGGVCGVIVGLHDHLALAREINRLLDDPEYYEIFAGGAARLAAGATYEAMISAYLDLAD